MIQTIRVNKDSACKTVWCGVVVVNGCSVVGLDATGFQEGAVADNVENRGVVGESFGGVVKEEGSLGRRLLFLVEDGSDGDACWKRR